MQNVCFVSKTKHVKFLNISYLFLGGGKARFMHVSFLFTTGTGRQWNLVADLMCMSVHPSVRTHISVTAGRNFLICPSFPHFYTVWYPKRTDKNVCFWKKFPSSYGNSDQTNWYNGTFYITCRHTLQITSHFCYWIKTMHSMTLKLYAMNLEFFAAW